VVIDVWLSGSELTLIRRSVLVQQLSVRKDPRPSSVVKLVRTPSVILVGQDTLHVSLLHNHSFCRLILKFVLSRNSIRKPTITEKPFSSTIF